MSSKELRQRFLDFFAARDHRILPSSSLVPDDPTLLLTGAGMIQFKPIFLGKRKVDFKRAATAQRCVRTTDIERVGKTARHLTFFEMLGNFSFGDYYKKEAIRWAWEFVTQDLKLPAEKLYVTIYEKDDEALGIWKKEAGLPEDRIVRLGEDDNFWSAGPTGPCGPCSELIYDMGEELKCDREPCWVGCDCDRWLEIWNLVFVEFDRDQAGRLDPLPRKNIDTGLGLERVAAVLQGVTTGFETETMKPVVDAVCDVAEARYGASAQSDASIKIVADHARAVTFLIGDGVLPSNEGRGYILRRLIRRAVRHGRLLGIEGAFLNRLAAVVIETMGDVYREIVEHRAFIERIVEHEEARFLNTLKQGLAMLGDVIGETKERKEEAIPGDAVFRLYDTYGFPVELTEEIAREAGLELAKSEFDFLMDEQRQRARAAWVGDRVAQPREVYAEVLEEFGKTKFTGYAEEETETTVKAIIRGNVVAPEAAEGDEIEVVLEKTAFYAEKGGQVGDRGTVETETGRVEVTDAQEPVPGLTVHKGRVVSGAVHMDQAARATVDAANRQAIRRNHTATHVLQWALRLVLGEHVKQAGSLVAPHRFRFDFTHFAALSREELEKVEQLVNEKIFENHPVRAYVTSYEFAKEIGAIALFEEKYEEFVRVVEIANFSKELCGGTHVSQTSEIGLLKITGEASVAANTRRIEGVTAGEALRRFYEQEKVLKAVAETLKSDSAQVAERVKELAAQARDQARQIESLRARMIGPEIEELLAASRSIDSTKVILKELPGAGMQELRTYADAIRGRTKSAVLLLASVAEGKVLLVAAATDDMVSAGFHAGDLLREVAPLVGGGGGGRADLAQAGGKDPAGVPKALEEAWAHIRKRLGGARPEAGEEEEGDDVWR